MTENEKKLLKQLESMVESYDIAMGVFKDSVAGGVMRGAFVGTISPARKLVDDMKGNK